MDPNEPVDVYEAINPTEAESIRGMLDSEGIEATVAGSQQGGFPGALPEVSLFVHAADAERARALIREHQLARSSATAEVE